MKNTASGAIGPVLAPSWRAANPSRFPAGRHDGALAERDRWARCVSRYRSGEWRAVIFRDMILDEARAMEAHQADLTILDIGCGGGFDGDRRLQCTIAGACARYIGVEPDTAMDVGEAFHNVHRCLFEDAPLEDGSVDIAFAVMVMEHFQRPERFYEKLHRVLRQGGVFWGFTMDVRHWFALASLATGTLGVKDWYLGMLHGRPGEERYENYPVYYRTNTPSRLRRQASMFSSVDAVSLARIGQLDFYLPSRMRFLGRAVDALGMRLGLPGSVLAVRLVK